MASHVESHPLSLALAVVASSSAPLLLLDSKFAVVAASTSFCDAFDIEPVSVTGCPILALGAGEWAVAGLRTLLERTVAGEPVGEPYEMELVRDGHNTRCLVIGAQNLDYDSHALRILVAVADVTDARTAQRLKDAMLEQKSVLLRETQHRIANSLQIIASVLMQSARQIKDGEARAHIQTAHSRVLSIAAVQQQLASSGLGNIEINSYLTRLCSSLGASMIGDPAVLTIKVQADKCDIDADVSVSLGLVVTELVINALKHAFPDHKGRILVGYDTDHTGWTLSVADDGIGMPETPVKPGLGSSIIEALAKQLNARVVIEAATPGTRVSLKFTERSSIQ